MALLFVAQIIFGRCVKWYIDGEDNSAKRIFYISVYAILSFFIFRITYLLSKTKVPPKYNMASTIIGSILVVLMAMIARDGKITIKEWIGFVVAALGMAEIYLEQK